MANKGTQVAVRNEGRGDLIFFDVKQRQVVVRRGGGTATALVSDGTLARLETAAKGSRPTLFLTKGEEAPDKPKPEPVDEEVRKARAEADAAGHSSGLLPQDFDQAERISRESGIPLLDRPGYEEVEESGEEGDGRRRKRRRKRAKS